MTSTHANQRLAAASSSHLTLLLLLASPLGGQQSPRPDFAETIRVELVDVEVRVTDSRGDPVTDLGPEDFEVRDNGGEVEVVNFYAARHLSSVAGAEPTRAGDEDAAAAAAEPPSPSSLPVDRNRRLVLVVVVDNLNLRTSARNRVLEALRGSLFFSLRAEDSVMVFARDSSLQLAHGPTNDPEALLPVIDRLMATVPQGSSATLERAAILRELQQTENEETAALLAPGGGLGDSGGADWGGLLESIRAYAAHRRQQVERTVAELGALADSLAGIVGRKALLYVSDGAPLRVGEALFNAWHQRAQGAGGPGGLLSVEAEVQVYDTTPLFESLARRANANGVTFYTLQPGGRNPQTITPAERSAFFSLSDPTNLGQVWTQEMETIEMANARGSLKLLADSTGGLAILDAHRAPSALQQLRRDLEHYYSLAYPVPKGARLGERRRIQVRVRDSSLRVRHRESYVYKNPDARMQDRVRATLAFGAGPNPLEVQIELGPEQRDSGGKFVLPIMVKFPLSKIFLLPGQRHHEGRVKIFVGVADDSGRSSAIETRLAPVQVPKEALAAALAQVAGYRMAVLLREGEHVLSVGVRDELADVESVTALRYTAGRK